MQDSTDESTKLDNEDSDDHDIPSEDYEITEKFEMVIYTCLLVILRFHMHAANNSPAWLMGKCSWYRVCDILSVCHISIPRVKCPLAGC